VLRFRADEEQRATNVELFFDLVFVFAITQPATLLKDDLSFAGAGRVLFLLLVLWWAWIYTTWTTNWFDAPGPHGRRRYRRRGLRAQRAIHVAVQRRLEHHVERARRAARRRLPRPGAPAA
jgi:hypothetical protein